MPNVKDNARDDMPKECTPGNLISAMAQLMQFVEKLDSHATLLNDMPIATDAKWDTLVGLIKKDVPLLKKDVSAEMTGFLTMMLKSRNE